MYVYDEMYDVRGLGLGRWRARFAAPALSETNKTSAGGTYEVGVALCVLSACFLRAVFDG